MTTQEADRLEMIWNMNIWTCSLDALRQGVAWLEQLDDIGMEYSGAEIDELQDRLLAVLKRRERKLYLKVL